MYVIAVYGLGILSITGKTWNITPSLAAVKLWRYRHEAMQYMESQNVREYYPFAYVAEIKV